MGGVSSLLCGLSLITILEVLWVVCVAILGCCRKQSHRRKMHNYVQQVGHVTPKSEDLPNCQTEALESNVIHRKDSRSIRKLSTKKRLGGNRHPANRSRSGFQYWDSIKPPIPLHTSTFRYRRNNSSAESGAASCNRLVTNNFSSEESRENPGYITDSSAPPSRRLPTKGELIVPRLNLEDLVSQTETEDLPCAWEDFAHNPWTSENLRDLNQISTVDIPNQIRMENVFREIKRLRSNAGNRRRPVYQPTENGRGHLCVNHHPY